MGQNVAKLAPEGFVVSRGGVCVVELDDRAHQRFGNIPSAELPEAAILAWTPLAVVERFELDLRHGTLVFIFLRRALRHLASPGRVKFADVTDRVRFVQRRRRWFNRSA